MIKYWVLIVIFGILFISATAETKPTTIYGTNTAYAGQIIKVYCESDFITKTRMLLAVDTVESSGNFEFKFVQDQPFLISVPLGIYQAVLYTEPSKTYQVVLPPLQTQTKADKLNPYFQLVEVYLGIKNIDTLDLNYQIAAFNEKYSLDVENNYALIFKFPRASQVDSLIQQLEQQFQGNNNKFFYDYRNYKYAWLKFASYMRDSRYVVRDYYNKQPFLYYNPAYTDLFNQLFANYLTVYMNSREGERLYSDVALAKSPTYIKQTFANNMVLLNDTLQELVLLKGLHDAFYEKDFPFQSLMITLDSVETLTRIQYHKTIAQNIRKKILLARTGYPAPAFELHDANGIFHTSNEYLANYVYLNFISIESFTCLQDLELLKKLNEKHKSAIRIVSVCIDDDFTKAVDYFKNKGYDWMLLSYSAQKGIIDDYKVRMYPSYYLIGPDGKLNMSPAPAPGENFEWYFFKQLQNRQ